MMMIYNTVRPIISNFNALADDENNAILKF